eukprot:s4298_g4.t1
MSLLEGNHMLRDKHWWQRSWICFCVRATATATAQLESRGLTPGVWHIRTWFWASSPFLPPPPGMPSWRVGF